MHGGSGWVGGVGVPNLLLDGSRLLLDALALDFFEQLELFGGSGTGTAFRTLQLVSCIHQIGRKRALTGSDQVVGFVVGLRSAQSAQAAAVDGRTQDDDLFRIDRHADEVRRRLQDDESVTSRPDVSDELTLFVLDMADLLIPQIFHNSVNDDLGIRRADFNLLLCH
jgi:hypothetical protein